MPRQRKVPIKKGEKRIVGVGETLRIEQTLFCGECNRRLKSATTQKPYMKVAMICDNIENHKTGKLYYWALKNIELVGSTI